MNVLIEQSVQCPYCGETINLLIDDSVPQQNYIEDCQVCCQPINLKVVVDPGGSTNVFATSGDE
jgi:hypothetical protein